MRFSSLAQRRRVVKGRKRGRRLGVIRGATCRLPATPTLPQLRQDFPQARLLFLPDAEPFLLGGYYLGAGFGPEVGIIDQLLFAGPFPLPGGLFPLPALPLGGQIHHALQR